MWNKFFNSRQILTIIPIIALLLFVAMLVFSMSIYSGGTRANFNASGYTFSENYISDLGRYISVNGQDNTSVMVVFILAFFLLGSSFFLFFYHNYYFIKEKFKPSLNIFRLATFFALCATISIVGVGLTPSDINFDDHVMFAEWIFRFFFGASVLYAISYFKINPKTKFLGVGYLILSIATGSYILFSDFQLNKILFSETLIADVLAQKFIVFSLIIGFFIIGYFNYQITKDES
tara:strand:- start:1 stop:702 length:702 start_codon:yes stop_codon:yes gene_type:complete